MASVIVCQPDPPDAVSTVQFIGSDSSADLLVGGWDSVIRLYNSNEGTLANSWDVKSPVLDVCSLRDSCFSAGCLSNQVLMGHLDRKAEDIDILGTHDAPVRCVAAHPSEHILFSGSWDRYIKAWDIRSRAESQRVDAGGKVFAIAVSGPAGKLVVCNSAKSVLIFDLRNLSAPESVREQLLKFQLRDVDCFPDGTGFAVASVEGRVAWEYFNENLGPSGSKKNYAFKCHREKVEGVENIHPVNTIAFHPTYGTFATAGGDGGVSIWDGHHKKRLWKLSTPYDLNVASCSFCPKSYRLAVGLGDSHMSSGMQGRVVVHPLKLEDVSRTASGQADGDA